MNYVKGLDVSQLQEVIDWKALAALGYQFCFLRCGVGNNGHDNMYAVNLAEARAAGFCVAAYHFIFPLPENGIASRSPAAQAAAHYAAAGDVPVVACDLEWPVQANWAKWGCTASQIYQWTLEYLQAYEKLSGVRPIVYTYPNYAQLLQLPESFGQTYKLWIASYENNPDIPAPWTDWVIWQDSGGTGSSATHLPNGLAVDTDKAKDLSLWNVADPTPIVETPVIEDVAINSIPIVSTVLTSGNNPNIFTSIWNTVSNLFKR